MHNLITWPCGHFVLLPSSTRDLLSPALRSSAIEDLWYLSDSAETDLGQTATDRHVKSSEPCTNCADTVEYPSLQRMRALKDMRMLRRLYTECKLNYLTSAGRYQLLDFSQKVAFVWDQRCALAHEHFWIERRVRSEDPFFAYFDDFLGLIDEAQALLLPEDADLPQVWAKVNEARAAVGKVVGAVNELAGAVDLMAQAPSKDRDSAEDENELRSREFMANNLRAEVFWMRMEDWVADAGTAMMAALQYGRDEE